MSTPLLRSFQPEGQWVAQIARHAALKCSEEDRLMVHFHGGVQTEGAIVFNDNVVFELMMVHVCSENCVAPDVEEVFVGIKCREDKFRGPGVDDFQGISSEVIRLLVSIGRRWSGVWERMCLQSLSSRSAGTGGLLSCHLFRIGFMVSMRLFYAGGCLDRGFIGVAERKHVREGWVRGSTQLE